MALSILDGNQSATTLSTILSSGQHITAHTVVSLGTQAITDMRGAVSGSVVSISNFPASQVISGTVTANPTGTQTIAGSVTLGASTSQIGSVTASISGTVPISISSVTIGNSITIGSCVTHGVTIANTSVTVNGTFYQATQPVSLATVPTHGVTLTSTTVTVSSMPAISGTVTASLIDVTGISGDSVLVKAIGIGYNSTDNAEFKSVSDNYPLPIQGSISGTVTANNAQGSAVTTSNFTSTTPSTVLAGFNATRKVLTIFNEGAGNLHISAGDTCTTVGYQVRLSTGDYYEVPLNQSSITHSAVFATAGIARVTQII